MSLFIIMKNKSLFIMFIVRKNKISCYYDKEKIVLFIMFIVMNGEETFFVNIIYCD